MGFLLQGKGGDPPTPEEEIPMDEKILAIYCLCADILYHFAMNLKHELPAQNTGMR
jgi:hypothetical protein